MDPPLTTNLKERAFHILKNAHWVFKITWGISPFLLTGVIFCKLIAAGFPAAIAWVGRNIINAVVDTVKAESHSLDLVLPWLLASLLLVVINETVKLFSQFLSKRMNEELNLKIDLDILNHVAGLEVYWFENPHFQDLMERARQNAAAHFTSFLNNMLAFGTNILKIAGLITILFIIEPFAVYLTVPLLGPYILFKIGQSKARYNKEYSRATKRRWRRYFATLLTNKGSVPEIKLFGLAPVLIERYRNLANEFIAEDRRIYTRGFIGSFLFAVVFSILVYGLYVRISWQVIMGSLTVGDIAMFAGAIRSLNDILDRVAQQTATLVEDTLYIGMLAELFDIEKKDGNKCGRTIENFKGTIEVHGVTFSYPGSNRTVLNNISLQINAGETVAIVGKNGSGKTTLAKLIAGFYQADEGNIYLDGHDIRELSQECLNSLFTFVFQGANRYEASASENIAFGDWQRIRDSQSVRKIAQLADVDSMISKMPEGYGTLLGRLFGTYDLSAGQWQKIAIARATARQSAAVLILDEPTSNLDAAAEYNLFLRFKELAAGRTSIIISHRFSTVSLADRIIVIDKGCVVEEGSHQQLLELSGLYASLYELHRLRMKSPIDSCMTKSCSA